LSDDTTEGDPTAPWLPETSVPGLVAKPIIDILLAVTDSADEDTHGFPGGAIKPVSVTLSESTDLRR
jgi:GrpB-like predicted nucleotidyltransferase (UPF0157 family)